MADDNVQHGIDDNPSGDAEKGAALGGLGGAAVGAAAGSLIGPVGTVVGAVVGGLTGAGASGLAVSAVDQVDNDNTVSGIGSGATGDVSGGGSTAASSTTDDLSGISATGPLAGALGGATAATAGVMGTGAGGTTGATGTGTEMPRVSRSEYDQLNDQDRMRVQLVEEELHVDKATRQAGEVQVSTHVVEEQVQVPVTLQHEEVTITRHAVNQPVDPATAGQVFQDQTIRVPVHEEVAQVTKTAHVAEEIEIEKRAVSEQRVVGDTVRREELDLQGGQQNVRTEGTTGTSGTGGV